MSCSGVFASRGTFATPIVAVHVNPQGIALRAPVLRSVRRRSARRNGLLERHAGHQQSELVSAESGQRVALRLGGGLNPSMAASMARSPAARPASFVQGWRSSKVR